MSNSASGEETPGDAVPAAQRSSWTSFIKAVASVSGDLSSLTAPPFILSPTSLTEFPAYWSEHPELFSAIPSGTSEEDRFLRVLRWFISTLKGQYTTRNETMGSEKKPLNPVLGELFFGTWPDVRGRGEQRLVVEQVSHHPPITAYMLSNEAKGLTLRGHSAQKTSFSSGSIIVKQIGHAILDVKLPGDKHEKYLITLPKLRIDGIWYGSPYIELSETSWISSSTGWASSIEYKGKGYFSGKLHSFKAQVYPPLSEASALSSTATPPNPKHVIEGQWHTTSKTKNGVTFTDVTGPKEEVRVKPISEQGPWETRKLWEQVAKGIREGDFEVASREKSKIENEQRQRRRDEAAAGTKWELRYFEPLDVDPDYVELIKLCPGSNMPESEDTYLYNPKEKANLD